MAGRRRSEPGDEPIRRPPPATTPEARENQLIAMAADLAEKQIRSGTASSQVITHFLKLGSSREKLEKERMQMEIQLMEAKREHMAAQAQYEERVEEALRAFRSYSGEAPADFEGARHDPDLF